MTEKKTTRVEMRTRQNYGNKDHTVAESVKRVSSWLRSGCGAKKGNSMLIYQVIVKKAALT